MDTSQLKSFSPEILCRELARYNAALGSTDAEGMLEVEITFVGGAAITGYPLRLDGSKNVIVSTGSGLAYFAMGQVQSIEVLDAGAAMSLLANESAETPPPPPSTPVVPATSPPRSDLRDELAKLNAVVSPKFGVEVLADVIDDPTFGDVGKNQFGEFLDVLRHALITIGDEPVGEITIQSLQQISIIAASGQLAVERSGPVMVIAVPFDEPFESTMSARLQTELQLNM